MFWDFPAWGYLKLFENVLIATKKVTYSERSFFISNWNLSMTYFKFCLINMCSTNLFVGTVRKSFTKVTRSSIRECNECAWRFNPDHPETRRKSFSSTKILKNLSVLCCHWNGSSILVFNKLILLTEYKVTHKHDVICISETYTVNPFRTLW